MPDLTHVANFRINPDYSQNLVLESNELLNIPSSSPYISRLSEVPDNGDIKRGPIIYGFTEVYDSTQGYVSPDESNQYQINYHTGDIIFNSANAGQQVTVSYQKKGTFMDASQFNEIIDAVNDFNIHIDSTNNPHNVTKEQIGLSDVSNIAQLPLSQLDIDTSLSADSNERVPSQHAVKMFIENAIQDISNGDFTFGGAEFPNQNGNEGKSLLTDGTNVLQQQIDHTTLLSKGTYDHSNIDLHIDSTDNPHEVTKIQIGLSNVDNSQQIPISQVDDDTALSLASSFKIPTQNAVKVYIDSAISGFSALPSQTGNAGKSLVTDGTISSQEYIDHTLLINKGIYDHSNIDYHIDSTDNPHNVTKTQIGLSNVDNSQQIPISQIDDDTSLSLNSNQKIATEQAVKWYIDNGLSNKQNLIGYTPENIANKDDDTALGASSVKYPTQNAVKIYIDSAISGLTILPSQSGNSGKSLVTDGTTASQNFIDHTSLLNIGTYNHFQIDSHIDNTTNPHSVTKSQIGLSDVDNSQQIPMSQLDTDIELTANSDQRIPSQHAVKSYVAAEIGSYIISQSGTETPIMDQKAFDSTNLQELFILDFTYNIGNRELLVFSSGIMMFCGVDYTENDETSIGFISGRELNEKVVIYRLGVNSSTDQTIINSIESHILNTLNPHSVTKSQVGLSNVDNSQQLPMSQLDTDIELTLNSDQKVPSEKATKTYIDRKILNVKINQWMEY